jgi:phospholipase C
MSVGIKDAESTNKRRAEFDHFFGLAAATAGYNVGENQFDFHGDKAYFQKPQFGRGKFS